MNGSPTKAFRLNVFQRLVRQWDRVHPYNAAQVLRIAGRADQPSAAALQAAWQDVLATLGLGRTRVDGRRFRFESVNGDVARFGVHRVPAGVRLQEYISAEMNRPFREGEDLPLRPFILEDDDPAAPGGESFYAGVIYQHWIADSESIRLLLREWFVRVYDPARARRTAVDIPRQGYWRHFGPLRSKWSVGTQVLSLLRSVSEFRRVRKLKTQGSSDYATRFLLRRLAGGTLDRLHAFARRHRLTLNDVFLATMAEACDRYVPMRDIPHRSDLALGTIVDLRSRSGQDFSSTFGLFLGFANVVCRRRDMADWPALVRDIARQSRRHKLTDAPQASSMWMFLALASGRLIPLPKAYHFYRKHMPLAGGISNVNLNHSWASAYHPRPLLEYLRVSPTGPMVPLVFTTTTLGHDFHVGLTYRTALISEPLAGEIAAAFVRRLTELAERGDALFGG